MGAVYNLTKNAHLFSLESVITENGTRIVTPNSIFVLDKHGNNTTVETIESIHTRFKAYGLYETYDLALSRLLVESLVSPTYRETINTRSTRH